MIESWTKHPKSYRLRNTPQRRGCNDLEGWEETGEPSLASVHELRDNRRQETRQRRPGRTEHVMDSSARVLRRERESAVVHDEKRVREECRTVRGERRRRLKRHGVKTMENPPWWWKEPLGEDDGKMMRLIRREPVVSFLILHGVSGDTCIIFR